MQLRLTCTTIVYGLGAHMRNGLALWALGGPGPGLSLSAFGTFIGPFNTCIYLTSYTHSKLELEATRTSYKLQVVRGKW